MGIEIKKQYTDNYEIQKVQDNTIEALRTMSNKPILNYVILNAYITTGDTIINHSLGRKIRGWIIINKDAASDIYQSSTTNKSPEKFLILIATANVNVTLYIF